MSSFSYFWRGIVPQIALKLQRQVLVRKLAEIDGFSPR